MNFGMRTCEICSADYRSTYSGQRTCGRKCGAELQHRNGMPRGRTCRRCGKRSESVTSNGKRCNTCSKTQLFVVRACDTCGKTFTSATPNAKRCSADCARRAKNAAVGAYISRRYHSDIEFRSRMLAAAHSRHARKLGLGGQRILLGYLIKRDHGKCGICRKPVRARKGPMRPSIDHIVPISRGGQHELANVQLAHYRCNLSKSNRGGGEQLLLIG